MQPELIEWDFSGHAFDGIGTQLVVPHNPLAGAAAFTIEASFLPEAGGPEEQRFVHVQADDGGRALLELRATPRGWYADVFVHFAGAGERFLNDPALLHPFGAWHTLALVRAEGELRQYVNGRPELSGSVAPGALGPGQVSVGMRLNRVSPFKGRIAEVRFSRRALHPEQLMLPSS
jgi:hypothetical protein